jgi:UDP-glucose 6-dehydrogenase
LRPALAGKVVDKAGKEVLQAGFGHGGDCISGMS